MKTIDITEMTDAALDVLLSVKAGDDCVVVDHLTDDERRSVCAALGITAPTHWISGAPYASPRIASRVSHIDYEGMILDEQDERFQD